MKAKPDAVAFFRDSKLIDGTIWACQFIKPKQFPERCIRIVVLTMSSYMKGKTIKMTSPNYTFIPAN